MTHTIMGYNSIYSGIVWFTQDEWYRTEVVCNNDIVRTDESAAIVQWQSENEYSLIPVGNVDQQEADAEAAEMERHYAYEEQGIGRI